MPSPVTNISHDDLRAALECVRPLTEHGLIAVDGLDIAQASAFLTICACARTYIAPITDAELDALDTMIVALRNAWPRLIERVRRAEAARADAPISREVQT